MIMKAIKCFAIEDLGVLSPENCPIRDAKDFNNIRVIQGPTTKRLIETVIIFCWQKVLTPKS